MIARSSGSFTAPAASCNVNQCGASPVLFGPRDQLLFDLKRK